MPLSLDQIIMCSAYVAGTKIAAGLDTVPVMDTERLGCAFEPEQLFEQPDGSPIRLDQDYRGLCVPPPVYPDPSPPLKNRTGSCIPDNR